MDNTEKDKVLGGFFWKFAERILSQGVTFVISVVLARILLPEEYGTIAMLQVFIVFANVFITSGFSSALIQKKGADDLDFSTMLYCSMAMSILLYGIIYFSAPFISLFYDMPSLTPLTRVFALTLILSGYYSIQNAWVSRHLVFKKFFYATFFSNIGSGVIGIVMAYRGYGVWALVAQSLSNTLINIVVMRCIIDWRPKLIFSWQRAKSLMNYGSKILATHIIATFCDEIRQLLIGKFYAPADLAFFNRGKQIPRLFNSNIDNTINSVLFPAMSNHGDNPEEVKRLTRRVIRTSSYILFFFMGMLAVTAEPLTCILLTDKWLPSVPYMQLVCIGGMISSVSTANLQAIKALGRSDVALKLEFIKKPIFLIMLIIGVKISVFALACTVPLYSIYAAYVNMSPNKKLLGYGIKEQLKDYVPATSLFLVMVLVTYPMSYLNINEYLKLFYQVLACTVVYIGTSLIFKVQSFSYLKKSALDIFKTKFKKR